MADQSPEIIDYKKVFDKLFEYHKYIRELNVKNRGNIKYIVNFTNFYKIYNILIKYAMNLIKKEEIIGSLKRNQENKKKEIKKNLSKYYKYCQDLKENIDIIKRELQAKVDKLDISILKNESKKLISEFNEAIEESMKQDQLFKQKCKEYDYNFYNNLVKVNTGPVSKYSNDLQIAYDKIIREQTYLTNEYFDIFYENYIKLMKELDKEINYMTLKNIDKIKKGLYVKKLKIDNLLNKNSNKKLEANSIQIQIKKPITNLNQYDLPTLQSNNENDLSTLFSKLKKPLRHNNYNKNSENRKKLAETLTQKLELLRNDINALTISIYPNNKKLLELKELSVNKLKNKINALTQKISQNRLQLYNEKIIKLNQKLMKTKEIENKIKLLTNNMSSNYEKLLLPQNQNMNRLRELELASKIRLLSIEEQLELKKLLKKQSNNLNNALNIHLTAINSQPINSAAGIFFTRNLNSAASKSA